MTSTNTGSRSFGEAALLVLFALSTVDALLTLTSVGLGIAYEANPLMDYMYAAHPLVFFMGKQSIMLFSCSLLLLAVERRPWTVLFLATLYSVFYSVLMVWHLIILGVV